MSVDNENLAAPQQGVFGLDRFLDLEQ